jgi:spermidine/putrescine transport system ATP-binding protein
VELRRLTKRFGETVAVEEVDLLVRSGEFLSILGPSGCGKTTTLRMISGLEDPSEGEIWISGRDATNVPPHRRNVNTVFQSYALFPHLTVAENVAYGLRVKKYGRSTIRERVARALDMVQLPQLADRRPIQLSGGQQQRVALARALVNEPDVLLLDEPLSALDLKLRQAMRIELKYLHERLGMTFVFVTHDQAEAITMSDRVAVMHFGRILQVGTPEDVYERPASRFVANFIGQTNLLEGRVEAARDADADVRLAGGALIRASVDAGELSPGSDVVVAVRPERLRVRAEPPEAGSDAGELAGTLTGLIYLGDATRGTIKLPDGTEIVALRPNDEEAHPFGDLRPGSAVRVGWPPGAARILTE